MIAATIQARMGSSRLPGKVLAPIVGKPMLELQIERVRASRLLDEVIVATSTKPEDDPIEMLAHRVGVRCHRGSHEDVLSRVAGALRAFGVDIHVELMGDSPLVDPLLVDGAIGYYLKHAQRYDVVTNVLKTTYPPGSEVTVHLAKILLQAQEECKDPLYREHVSLAITRFPPAHRVCNLEAPAGYFEPQIYLEVDAEEDLEVVRAVFEHFYPQNPAFGLAQVLDFMRAHPTLAQRNRHVPRRWKVFREEYSGV